MNEENLQNQIDALTKRMNDFEVSSTIPIQVDKAFVGRGFLKANTLMISGQITIPASGQATIQLVGANVTSIALANTEDGSAVGTSIGNSGVFPLTGTLTTGATSATLLGDWQFLSGVYSTTFENGDIRNVTYTNGATTMTWTGGLSGNSLASVSVAGIRETLLTIVGSGASVVNYIVFIPANSTN